MRRENVQKETKIILKFEKSYDSKLHFIYSKTVSHNSRTRPIFFLLQEAIREEPKSFAIFHQNWKRSRRCFVKTWHTRFSAAWNVRHDDAPVTVFLSDRRLRRHAHPLHNAFNCRCDSQMYMEHLDPNKG